jgi:hypothetical protein
LGEWAAMELGKVTILLSIPVRGRGRDGAVDSSTSLSVLVLDPSFHPVKPMGLDWVVPCFDFRPVSPHSAIHCIGHSRLGSWCFDALTMF